MKTGIAIFSMLWTVAAAAEDIVGVAAANGQFTKLVEAVTTAGLVDTLKGIGPYTVFAPTDDAFARVIDFDELLKDKVKLKALLLNHVVSGKVMAADLKDGDEVVAVGGNTITVTINGLDVMIDNAMVATADIPASNGVIHSIDMVLPGVADTIAVALANELFLNPVEAGSLELASSNLNPSTYFAPSQEAFFSSGVVVTTGKEKEDFYFKHLVSGKFSYASLYNGQTLKTVGGSTITVTIVDGRKFINGAQIIARDGVLSPDFDYVTKHTIDGVLFSNASSPATTIKCMGGVIVSIVALLYSL